MTTKIQVGRTTILRTPYQKWITEFLITTNGEPPPSANSSSLSLK